MSSFNRFSQSVCPGKYQVFKLLMTAYLSNRAPPVSIDQVISDFDNVSFHVSTPETKSKILISITLKCYAELVQYGAQQVLEREYGQFIVAPEAGYDFSILIDLENLPAEPGRWLQDG